MMGDKHNSEIHGFRNCCDAGISLQTVDLLGLRMNRIDRAREALIQETDEKDLPGLHLPGHTHNRYGAWMKKIVQLSDEMLFVFHRVFASCALP